MSGTQRRGRKRKQFDDEVYSLRLNRGISKEAKALNVLDSYMKQVNPDDGKRYSARYVLTEALIALGRLGFDETPPVDPHEMADQLSEGVEDVYILAGKLTAALDQVEQLAKKLESVGVAPKASKQAAKKEDDDSPNMSFMRNLAKTAMRRDEEQK